MEMETEGAMFEFMINWWVRCKGANVWLLYIHHSTHLNHWNTVLTNPRLNQSNECATFSFPPLFYFLLFFFSLFYFLLCMNTNVIITKHRLFEPHLSAEIYMNLPAWFPRNHLWIFVFSFLLMQLRWNIVTWHWSWMTISTATSRTFC